MKDDEKTLLRLIYERGPQVYSKSPYEGRDYVRDIINSCGINNKRCWYLLEKWCGKDWYEYGVSLDLGWLTNKGIAAAQSL